MRNLEGENAALRNMIALLLPMIRAPRDAIEMTTLQCASRLLETPQCRAVGPLGRCKLQADHTSPHESGPYNVEVRS
jgi:hypothetical protein